MRRRELERVAAELRLGVDRNPLAPYCAIYLTKRQARAALALIEQHLSASGGTSQQREGV